MIRIGMGYDLHRIEQGRPLILGGVEIPWDRGLAGHSDADVLAHAVTDAVLGAAALGNIGEHFPDTDPQYKDADSMQLLKRSVEMLREAGWSVANVDSTVVAQAPKLLPHIPAIRERLAEVLDISVDCVSVKAKTNEHVGPEGRGEAMSAQAAVLIQSSGGEPGGSGVRI